MKFVVSSIVPALAIPLLTSALLIPPGDRNLDDLRVWGGGGIRRSQSSHVKRSLSLAEQQQRVFQSVSDGGQDDSNRKKEKKKVPVKLGVMSKCPDAGICESVFDKVVPQVEDIIDLEMVYIGKVNESMTPYGVECKHGASECDGNVQQLCVQKHVESTKDWWTFIQCQNFEKPGRVGDVSLARTCSKLISHDWDSDFSSCYTSSEGRDLLRASVKQAEALNVTKSCSILVNDHIICVHDGGWKDCVTGHEAQDFVKLIEQSYKDLNEQV